MGYIFFGGKPIFSQEICPGMRSPSTDMKRMGTKTPILKIFSDPVSLRSRLFSCLHKNRVHNPELHLKQRCIFLGDTPSGPFPHTKMTPNSLLTNFFQSFNYIYILFHSKYVSTQTFVFFNRQA